MPVRNRRLLGRSEEWTIRKRRRSDEDDCRGGVKEGKRRSGRRVLANERNEEKRGLDFEEDDVREGRRRRIIQVEKESAIE